MLRGHPYNIIKTRSGGLEEWGEGSGGALQNTMRIVTKTLQAGGGS